MAVNENALTKGELRKLNALRKSIGHDLADEAFSKWLKRRHTEKQEEKADPVGTKITDAMAGLMKDKSVNLGRYGYTVRRAKGKGASGFVATRNEKS